MRAIERTRRFKCDYKRESRGRHRADLDKRLAEIVQALAADTPLDPRHHDHALSGPWTDFRDCHLRPDLILIYQKPDAHTLRLVRIGSHAELGL
ncbi:MAG: type II toxin-antitoxin system YafQ family toxin [Gammaproteobacteria bacterium]|nr:type II toxin-antitoxin system YafQ family toxin [Gammaproteobacteria bacterium]MYF66468.1 type II toxin-antitoxin system YafQ family toxin [Gammaproteobacteria bacterium]MYK37214.1 type II toxin-antitoxin system YafQ family toxin [Gammaproteobacteria bacterium]